ncbi:MAG: YkuS family protein [Bacillota bacterium]
MKRIAVEPALSQVKSLLKEQGYEIMDMDQFQNADCVVINGGDDNLMGIQDALTKAPVIDANGMTAQQVLDQIKRFDRS